MRFPQSAQPQQTAELKDHHQALNELSKFPMNQLWRFVVDGKLQIEEGGWKAYDAREPGSVAAAIRGMTHAIKHR